MVEAHCFQAPSAANNDLIDVCDPSFDCLVGEGGGKPSVGGQKQNRRTMFLFTALMVGALEYLEDTLDGDIICHPLR